MSGFSRAPATGAGVLVPDSPAIKRQRTNVGGDYSRSNSNSGYNSGNDSGDELFEGINHTPRKHFTQPTQVIAGHQTQPTQILNRGQSPQPLASSPLRPNAELQVLASSPFQPQNGTTPQVIAESPSRSSQDIRSDLPHAFAPRHFQAQPRPLGLNRSQASVASRSSMGSSMAPAGTQFRTPHGVVRAVAPREKPKPIILLEDDDGPQYKGTGSDDDSKTSADIKPSSFHVKAKMHDESRAKMPVTVGGSQRSGMPHNGGRTDFSAIVAKAHYDPSKFSQRSGFGNPQVRSDSLSSAYGSRKPPYINHPPYRAQPVEADTALTEETNPVLRSKMMALKAIYKHHSDVEIRKALIKHHLDFDDAAGSLAEATDLVETNEVEELPTMNAVIKNRGTIRERLIVEKSRKAGMVASSQAEEIPIEETQQKPRRRLQQGRKRRDSTPIEVEPSPKKAVEPVLIVSDDETDGASQNDPEEYSADLEGRVLKFLNTCNAADLADTVSIKPIQADAFVAAQPFKSLYAAELYSDAPDLKTGKKSTRVPIGERIVENARSMLRAYEAVDYLVQECHNFAKPLTKEMGKWGFDVFGAAKGDGIAMTSFESQDGSKNNGADFSNRIDGDATDDGVVASHKSRSANFLKQPSMMNPELALKDYQIVGLNWLNLIWKQRLSCILADDMGLGKTCQVISFLSHLVETGVNGPHLIIVPSSVLENWVREMIRFSPEIVYEIYAGSQPQRAQLAEEILANRESINVVFASYDNSRRKEDNDFLRRLKPTVAVFDEGHSLKNAKSQRYTQLMKIRAEMRVLLTGTPLQNNLQELAAILGFILPNVFAERTEELDYIFKYKATTSDSDHSALLSAQRTQRAKEMLAPFVLRRKKEQVLKHMPPKTCRVQYCELEPAQVKIYNDFTAKSEELKRLRKEGVTTNVKGELLKGENNPVMQLRKAAIHPMLFRRHFTDAKLDKMMPILKRAEPVEFKQRDDQVLGEMKLHSDFVLHGWCRLYPSIRKFDTPNLEWMNSGKITALVNLVKQYKANGDRVLVFSQFTMVLDILQEVLQTIQVRYLRIDGGTAVDDRQLLIDDFRDDESITAFLLSTGAGGQGLNLMYANKVIIFDQSFNPQDDVQAENRAHRVGQTRPVEIVRLITKGTIEVAMYVLGRSKLELDNKVSGGSSAGGKSMEQQVMEMMTNGRAEVVIEGADEAVQKVSEESAATDDEVGEHVEPDGPVVDEKETADGPKPDGRASRSKTKSPAKKTNRSGRLSRTNSTGTKSPSSTPGKSKHAAKKSTGIKITIRKPIPKAEEDSDSELSDISESLLSP